MQKAMIATKAVPWKMPKYAGKGLSKKRLCNPVTMAEIMIAPKIPVSKVFIPAISVSPAGKNHEHARV